MPGINLLFAAEKSPDTKGLDQDYLFEDHLRKDIIDQEDNFRSWAVAHEGYPIRVFEDGRFKAVVEGLIYNFTDQELNNAVQGIADAFRDGRRTEDLVASFIDQADGDYLIAIREKAQNRTLVFNDFFGRLPFFYYLSKKRCILGRDMKFLLEHLPEIRIFPEGLAEYLVFEFPLGDKTLFSGVRRLQPASGLVIETLPNEIRFEVKKFLDVNAVTQNPYSSMEEALQEMRAGLIEAAENRVKYLRAQGYHLIADLSGGMDSRLVAGLLSKNDRGVDYVSFWLSTNRGEAAETTYAEAIFKALGSPGRFTPVMHDYTYDIAIAPQMVYWSDGANDYHSTCCQFIDIRGLKQRFPAKTARFTGLGGELFKKALNRYFKSYSFTVENGLYARSHLPMRMACKAAWLPLQSYRQSLAEYEKTMPEKTPADKLKKLYIEYYINYVMALAEDRERNYFWTVLPLYGLPFMRLVYNRLPSSLRSYTFYSALMAAIDDRLLDVPLYGLGIDLRSQEQIARLQNRAQKLNRKWTLLQVITPPWLKEKLILSGLLKKSGPIDFGLFDQLLSGLGPTSGWVNWRFLKEYISARGDAGTLTRATTLLMYFSEIEKRVSEKIH